MPDYSSMSDDQYRELMRQQAMGAQVGAGFASDPSQTIPPVTDGTVKRWPVAVAPQQAAEPPPGQGQSEAPVVAQNLPQGNPAPPGGGGFNFDRLEHLSNANTASTIRAMNENQGELYRAQQDKAEAIRREAELQSKTDAEIATYNQKSIDQQALLQAQNQRREMLKQQDVQSQMDKYESIKDDFLNSKIDPQNAWRHGLFGDHMTANKVFAAIGLALAGFGGPNAVAQASQQINTAIDRDIAIQSADIAKKGRAADMQHNMVGMYRQAYQDQVQSDLAAKMALQEQALNVINQKKLNAKSQSDLNMADQLEAQLKSDFADTQNKFLQASNAVVTQGIMQQANLENLKGEQEYRRGVLGISALKAANAGAGQKIPASEVAKLADLQTALHSVEQLRDNFRQNATGTSGKIASLPGGEWAISHTSTDAQKYISARQIVKQLVGKAMEGGVLRKEDEEKYDAWFPQTGVFDAKAQMRFDAAIKNIQNAFGTRVQALQATGYNTGTIAAGGAPTSMPETRNVGGKTYQKVPGGWQLAQ